MRTALLLVALLPFLIGAAKEASEKDEAVELVKPGDGALYRNSLASLIRRSNRIVVTEHSDQMDSFDFEAGKTRIRVPIVYGTRELSPPQRVLFLKTIETLNPETQNAFSACVPEVHHTIYFYADDVLKDTMDVCFQCGEVSWSGSRATPPGALYSALEEVVKKIGLNPHRDWKALAKKNLKTIQPNTSPERKGEQ